MKESQQTSQQEDNIIHIPMLDFGYNAFKRFLRYLYGESVPSITTSDDNNNNNSNSNSNDNLLHPKVLLELIRLAHMHLLFKFKLQLEQYILNNWQKIIGVENVSGWLTDADTFELHNLRKVCLAFINSNINTICNLGYYQGLSNDLLEDSGVAKVLREKVNTQTKLQSNRNNFSFENQSLLLSSIFILSTFTEGQTNEGDKDGIIQLRDSTEGIPKRNNILYAKQINE